MPEIFTHKKFQAGIALSLAVFFGQLAPAIPLTNTLSQALGLIDWLEVMTPVLVAIGAQGVADVGKEALKAEVFPQLGKLRVKREAPVERRLD